MAAPETRTLVTRRIANGETEAQRTDLRRDFGYVSADAPEGPYPLPRDRAYEARLLLFLEDHGLSLYEGFENDVFVLRPPTPGPCACGHAERESAWFEIETHEKTCFQAESEELRERHGGLGDVPETALKELCLKHGIPWNEGYASAVHCDCDFDERWQAWLRANDHADDCPVVQANFEYKPNGFWMRWPEHPILGAAMSRAIDREQFRDLLEHCGRSVRMPAEDGAGTEAERGPLAPITSDDEERLALRVSLAEHRAALEGLVAILQSRELEAAELVAWLNGYRCPEAIVDRNQAQISAARSLLVDPRARAAIDSIRRAQRFLESRGDVARETLERLTHVFGRAEDGAGR
jgi:hypothetical protein